MRVDAADLEAKIPQDLQAMRGMCHLGMKLDAEELPLEIGEGSVLAVLSLAQRDQRRREISDRIGMTHPYLLVMWGVAENRIAGEQGKVAEPVLAGSRLDGSSQMPGEQLVAIANAQQRQAEVQQLWID